MVERLQGFEGDQAAFGDEGMQFEQGVVAAGCCQLVGQAVLLSAEEGFFAFGVAVELKWITPNESDGRDALLLLAVVLVMGAVSAASMGSARQATLGKRLLGLVVTDLRTKKTWRQAWLEKDIGLQHRLATLDAKERLLTLECGLAGITATGKPGLVPALVTIRLHPTRPDVECTIEPTKAGRWRQAAYPYGFVRDGAGVSNLFPHAEGAPGASGALARGESYVPGKAGARIYFGVSDVAATLHLAVSAGGAVNYPVTEVPGYGVVAEFIDTEGNCIALFASRGGSTSAAEPLAEHDPPRQAP